MQSMFFRIVKRSASIDWGRALNSNELSMLIILMILDLGQGVRIAPHQNILAPHKFCLHNNFVPGASSHFRRSMSLSPPPSSFGGFGATFRGCAFFGAPAR